MRQRILLCLVVFLIAVVAFTLGFEARRPNPPRQSSPQPQSAGSPQQPTELPQPLDRFGDTQPPQPAAPPNSGHKYYALDLLRMRSFPDQGRLVFLNVVSQPSPLYGDVVSYTTLHRNIPEIANVRGVRFKRMVGPHLYLYDIVEALPNEENVDEPTAVGQIVVEVNPGVTPPGYENNWEVEPDGFQEATATDGTVLHIPKVRFWRYE